MFDDFDLGYQCEEYYSEEKSESLKNNLDWLDANYDWKISDEDLAFISQFDF